MSHLLHNAIQDFCILHWFYNWTNHCRRGSLSSYSSLAAYNGPMSGIIANVSPSVEVELCYSELEREVIPKLLVQHKLFPLDFLGSLERAKWRNVECLHSCWCPMVFNIHRNPVKMWTSTLSLEVHICLQLWHEALPSVSTFCPTEIFHCLLQQEQAGLAFRFKGTRSFQRGTLFLPVSWCTLRLLFWSPNKLASLKATLVRNTGDPFTNRAKVKSY